MSPFLSKIHPQERQWQALPSLDVERAVDLCLEGCEPWICS